MAERFENLVDSKDTILFGKDGIVVTKHVADIPGGRVLDVEGWPSQLTVIPAGTVIVKKDEDNYKPMPVAVKTETKTVDGQSVTENVLDEDGNPVYIYGSLPSNYAYVGILCNSVRVSRPGASILVQGSVNEGTLPFEFATIKSAFHTACPGIVFVSGKETAS